MYIVLSGARANIGDFLITERSKALLQKFRPEHELVQLPHWEPLDSHLEKVNSADAVIIMGGPGFQPGFYPKVYKLTEHIENIKIPVIPMGLGWKGFPGDFETLSHYRFSESSLSVLKTLENRATHFGCRDYLTVEALKRNGISNGLMTGCPVWYDLGSIGKEMVIPSNIKKVVFTPPHRPMFKKQAFAVMKMLKELFPNATRYCSFHRGITIDGEHKRTKHEKMNPDIKATAKAYGFEVVDVSSDLLKINFYKECDLHVGYRVHGHLEFISCRRPSILIHEDGRGRGVSEAINAIGVDGFRRNLTSSCIALTKSKTLKRAFDSKGITIAPNPSAVAELKKYLEDEIENGFARFRGLPHVIDTHFERMKSFLAALP